MATQAKLTIKRGQRDADIVIGAGSAITGHNAIEVNIDQDGMTQADAVAMIRMIADRVATANWPLS